MLEPELMGRAWQVGSVRRKKTHLVEEKQRRLTVYYKLMGSQIH